MKSNKKLKNINLNLSQIFIIIQNIQNNSDQNTFWELIIQFYKIWPPFQWMTSLLILVVIYWMSGYFYNKFLSHKGGWMDIKTRIIMIIIDLILNFGLGIYYMQYRDTFIGALLLKCPVFFSPLFWLVELVCFFLYFRGGLLKKNKKIKKMNNSSFLLILLFSKIMDKFFWILLAYINFVLHDGPLLILVDVLGIKQTRAENILFIFYTSLFAYFLYGLWKYFNWQVDRIIYARKKKLSNTKKQKVEQNTIETTDPKKNSSKTKGSSERDS